MNVLLFGSRMDLISGHSRPAYELADNLIRSGHAVRILTTPLTPTRYARHQALKQQQAYLKIPTTMRLPLSPWNLLWPSATLTTELARLFDWADVVHGFSGWSSHLLLRRAPAELAAVLTLNLMPNPRWRDLGALIAGWLPNGIRASAMLGMLLPRAAHAQFLGRYQRIFSWTRFLAEEYAGLGVATSRIQVIPIGIDTRRLQGPQPDTTGAATVLFHGQMTPIRGIDRLIKAFPLVLEQVPSAQLVIADRGPHLAVDSDFLRSHRQRAVTLIDRLGLQDHVTLKSFDPEIATTVRRADVVALPFSLPYAYSQPPLTVLESLALGRPVVSSSVGCIPEIVDDPRLGAVVDPDDANALAAAIVKQLAEDSPDKRAYRRRTMAARHHWGEATVAIERVYQEAVTRAAESK